ncbi:MAG: choice-of-anchor J domain-containing protein, partial [Bacteroidales bacterium]|nr:choice-of-anchor J domain-containing protein [Bacteroidales bacterium]
MRKLTFLLLFTVTVYYGNTQTILSEDFSSGALPAGWQNVDNGSTGFVWYFNNPNGRTINTTTNANGFAIFDSDYNSGGTEDCDLISPVMDCSANTVVKLKFEHYFYSGWGGAAEVFVSGDNGMSWTSLEAWSASSTNNAETSEYDVSSTAAGQSQVLVKWNWQGDYSWYWAVDDIVVYEPLADDLMAANVILPTPYCGMTTDTIRVQIVNAGTASQTSYSATYSIDGGTMWITPENITTTLNSGDTLNYTFTTLADFSTPGTYDVLAAVILAGDGDNSNDTIAGNSVYSSPIISSYPYIQDFEGTQYWNAGGSNYSWA